MSSLTIETLGLTYYFGRPGLIFIHDIILQEKPSLNRTLHQLKTERSGNATQNFDLTRTLNHKILIILIRTHYIVNYSSLQDTPSQSQ